MFLRPLNNEKKELFLDLALAAAIANDVLEDAEKTLLAAYADEMSIDVNKVSQMPVEEICRKLKIISNAEAMDLDTLPDPDYYLLMKRIKQLYNELYKEKNITKFRNTKIPIERKVAA